MQNCRICHLGTYVSAREVLVTIRSLDDGMRTFCRLLGNGFLRRQVVTVRVGNDVLNPLHE